jgi:hypothetical protein
LINNERKERMGKNEKEKMEEENNWRVQERKGGQGSSNTVAP